MKFQRSQFTELIIELLRGVNEEISYSELAKRARCNVPDLKKVLGSARRALLTQKIMFEPIIGFGLRRLDDSGKVVRSEKNKKRLRSSSKRSIKELDTIQSYSELSHDQQIKATLNRTLFELVLREPDAEKEKLGSTKVDMPTNIVHIPKLKP